jgi:UDP-GlcNAc:undecaprenyl-phosphate GlcNAc-1-phosphate transferase
MPPILLAFLYAFVSAAALVPVCRLVARRTGIVARPRDDRWHREIVPLLGGVALALALVIGAAATGIAWEVAVPLGTALLMFAVGLVDDVVSLRPATKLIAQIALAAALVYFGYRLQWIESRLLDSVLTVVWVLSLIHI